MPARAKITSKGQVTIPASVRKALGTKRGDVLVFEPSGSAQFTVRNEEQMPSLEGMFRRYAKARPVTLKQMDEAIARSVSETTRPKK